MAAEENLGLNDLWLGSHANVGQDPSFSGILDNVAQEKDDLSHGVLPEQAHSYDYAYGFPQLVGSRDARFANEGLFPQPWPIHNHAAYELQQPPTDAAETQVGFHLESMETAINHLNPIQRLEIKESLNTMVTKIDSMMHPSERPFDSFASLGPPPPERPRYLCKLCSSGNRKVYGTRGTFRQHISLSHRPESTYHCDVEGCGFSSSLEETSCMLIFRFVILTS